MRIEAGGHRYEAFDGTVIHVDRPLSRDVGELLVGVINRSGLTPNDVFAVTFSGEAPPRIETVQDAIAQIKLEHGLT